MRWFRHRRGRQDGPSGWHGRRAGQQVLVEHADPEARELLRQQLVDHGYRVATCGGPIERWDGVECPLLADETCRVVEEADAIISGMDLGVAANRRLVAALTAADPDRPLIVEPRLRVTDEDGTTLGRHHLYRTTIAPLVRRLHDALWGQAQQARRAP